MKFQILLLCSITLSAFSLTLGKTKFTQHGGMAFQMDSLTLCIVTTQGDTLIFRDRLNPQYAENFICHRLFSYLPVQKYWVILKSYYEGGGWQLINGENGRVNTVISIPIPSPDGNRLVCANADIVACFNDNGIEVWRIDPDSLALEFQDLNVSWGPVNTDWKNDSTIIFEKFTYDANWEIVTRPGRLELSNDGTWVPDDTVDWD
ncbi:MAG: hypothetical protein K8S15_06605 [Candidatus Aegiribacteria sp.]|nr:hypothetical protein [Candidatus Aegiribacteria sp.]